MSIISLSSPSDKLESFDTRLVEVGGYIGERLELTWRHNLLALDWENDFLAPFREKNSPAGFYVGLGKTLEAVVRFAHHTRDAELLQLRQYIVDTLLGAQLPDGYLGCYAAPHRNLKVWDAHEQAYLLFALVTDWNLFREERILSAAVTLGDYLLKHLPREILEQVGAGESCEELSILGLDRAILALHGATGEARFLDYCIEALQLRQWQRPIVEGRHGQIEGHAYAHLTRCLAQLELYGINGDKALLGPTVETMRYLQRGGLVVTGACSQEECWHSNQDGTGDLGETCATAYLIRWWGQLLRLTGEVSYGDYIERAVYNALFAAQSPDGRRLRYYTPFEGKREYWDKDTYCCPGNFRRIMAELPEMIFYRPAGGVMVNLYTNSCLTTEIAPRVSLKLRQETDYPNSGNIAFLLRLSETAAFALHLRIPAWCDNYEIELNGKALPKDVVSRRPSGALAIEREWCDGDRLTLNLEIPWRTVRGFAEQEGRRAIMRGPLLFCLNPQRNELESASLKSLTLDTSALQVVPDRDMRAKGLSANVTICDEVGPQSCEPRRTVHLTEFVDPAGEATYFQVNESVTPVDDELQEIKQNSR